MGKTHIIRPGDSVTVIDPGKQAVAMSYKLLMDLIALSAGGEPEPAKAPAKKKAAKKASKKSQESETGD